MTSEKRILPAQFFDVFPAMVAMFAISATFSLYNFALFETVMNNGWPSSFVTLVFNGCFVMCIAGFIALLFRPMLALRPGVMLAGTLIAAFTACILFMNADHKAVWVLSMLYLGGYSVLWHQNVRLTLIENAKKGEYARVFSLYAISHIAGNLSGAFLYNTLYPAVSVPVLLLLCYAIALLALTLYPRRKEQKPFQGHEVPSLRRFGNLLRSIPALWIICIASGFIGETYFNFLTPFLKSSGIDSQQALTCLTAFMIGGVAVKFPVAWMMDRFGFLRVSFFLSGLAISFNGSIIWRGGALIAALAVLVNLNLFLMPASAPVLLWAVCFMIGACLSSLTIVGDTAVASGLPKRDHQEGVTMSILVYFLGGLLGNSLVGPAMDHVHAVAFPALTIVFIGLMTVGLVIVRQQTVNKESTV